MNNFLYLLIALAFTFIVPVFSQGQKQNFFTYDDKGKRDPFLPLVDEDGRYLLDSELLYTSDELKLSGILWDSQGKSSCLINNQIVKVGESVGGFMVKEITKDNVTLTKDGNDYIIGQSNEDAIYGTK